MPKVGVTPKAGTAHCWAGCHPRVGTAHCWAELTCQIPTAQIHPLQQAAPGGQQQAGKEHAGGGREEAGRARARAMPERRWIEEDLITHFASSKAAEL